MNDAIKRLWKSVGLVGFWALWPAWFVYFRLSPPRTRVLVRCGDEFLVVMGWLGAREFILPGGGLRRHEPPRDGAVRELREEVGIDADAASLVELGSAPLRLHGLGYQALYFVLDLPAKPAVRLQRFELTDARWLRFDDAGSVPLNTDTRTALDLLGSSQA